MALSYILFTCLSLFANQAICQTPSGYPPITQQQLLINYNSTGNDTFIEPDQLLAKYDCKPHCKATSRMFDLHLVILAISPTISYKDYTPGTVYMLLMMDLSVPHAILGNRVPENETILGVPSTRVNFVQWLQTNMIQSGANGPLAGSTAPLSRTVGLTRCYYENTNAGRNAQSR